jgi:hypothetical protein
MPPFRSGVAPIHGIAEGRQREGNWTIEEKREYLTALSMKIWDTEEELAKWKAEKFELMNSLQSDLRSARDGGVPTRARSLQRA